MEVLVDRCAGLDVHKKTVVACVRTPGTGRQKRASEVRTVGTFEHQLIELREWLIECGVTSVAMEATGVYWKAVWHVLDEDQPFEMLLANPAHIKNVPGRKTDVNDATWIAQLLECGLLRGSFVPPVEIRELREVTRYRRQLTEERARETQRLQKVLEDASVKLSSVASDVLGVTGRFNDHHAGMVSEIIAHVDYLTAAIARLDERVEAMMVPFRAARELLTTIPGIQQRTAEIMLAEIGVDMTRFATPGHLASWAGVWPGNNESAGKHRSTHTRSGDPWLQSALVEAAWANIRSKNCYLAVRFWRLAKRRGQQRALIAVAHTLLVIIWHMLSEGTVYTEIGVDYLARNDNPDRRRRHLVKQLEQLGYQVELTPAA